MNVRLEFWLLSYFVHATFQARQHAVQAFSSKPITHSTSITPKRFDFNGCLLMAENGENDAPKSPKVKFNSLSTSIPTNAAPVDIALTWLTSDIGSIVLGGVGLLLLLIGRLVLDNDTGNNTSPEAMAEQTRVNLLAVFAVGAVLLNGLSQLDVQSALAEKVDLLGKVVSQPIILSTNYDRINDQISWVLSSILAATPAGTVILLVRSDDEGRERWKPIAYVGVLPPNMFLENPQCSTDTPIMDRMLRVTTSDSERRESYLPTLQALPGRIELTNDLLLPTNTQAALLLPIRLASTHTATLLLGSNQARSFTPRDITWSQTVATRLELPLS